MVCLRRRMGGWTGKTNAGLPPRKPAFFVCMLCNTEVEVHKEFIWAFWVENCFCLLLSKRGESDESEVSGYNAETVSWRRLKWLIVLREPQSEGAAICHQWLVINKCKLIYQNWLMIICVMIGSVFFLNFCLFSSNSRHEFVHIFTPTLKPWVRK